VIIDPGFGFSKTLEQNYLLLQNLPVFHVLERPILVGISRKSMIYKKLNIQPEEALNGTTILNTYAIQKGASILRVHDVKEAKQIIQLLG
jgi:dihydropteroate synthase